MRSMMLSFRRACHPPSGWGCAVIGVLAIGCGRESVAPPAPAAPTVVISRPERREITDYAEYTGRTAAVDNVELRARVSGYLTKVNFEAGQEVPKGQLLFQIDERPFQAALAAAAAEVTRLDALITKNRGDVERRKTLREQNIIPQEEFDQAVADLAVSEASRLSAVAAVDQAQLDLDYTSITAPVTGRVGRAAITAGNLVIPGGSPNSLLTTLVSMDPVYIYFDIDETTLLDYMQRTREAQRPEERGSVKNLKIPVVASLANESNFSHEGLLEFVDNQVNLSTGTLQARAVFDNANRFLRIGLYARVRLPVGDAYSALVVPETAIGTDQSRRYVLVVGANDIVESRTVELGRRQPDGTRVISSGLKGDERIVVEGLLRARPLKPVTPVELASLTSSDPAATEPAAPPK